MLGTPMMPWQQLVADVALEIDPDTGFPAYREVWFSVMRQSGKTTLVLPIEVHRCISPVWGSPQRVAYTAQTGWEAQKKLIEEQVPIIQASPLARLITKQGGGKVRRAQGNWGVNFGGSGGKIDVLGSTESAGHGGTLDLGVIDEAWRDEDDRREQSMLPAMVTRPGAQLFGYSTMGTDASIYLNRKVDVGRAAAVEDSGRGMAYFEWSIPDDEDIDDPEVWWRYMPALGWTIQPEAIAHARQSMSDGEFRRAFGNQRMRSQERVIPADVWDAVQDPDAAPEGRVTFAVDVNIDQASASIAVSDGESAEVVTSREGVSWLVGWFKEKPERRRWPVAVDAGGPVSSVLDDLERAGVRLVRRTGPEVAAACGRMFNALADGDIRIRPSSAELDEAVAGVATKPVGDKFVWSRQTSASDVTPLMAATLAYANQDKGSPGIAVIDY